MFKAITYNSDLFFLFKYLYERQCNQETVFFLNENDISLNWHIISTSIIGLKLIKLLLYSFFPCF